MKIGTQTTHRGEGFMARLEGKGRRFFSMSSFSTFLCLLFMSVRFAPFSLLALVSFCFGHGFLVLRFGRGVHAPIWQAKDCEKGFSDERALDLYHGHCCLAAKWPLVASAV